MPKKRAFELSPLPLEAQAALQALLNATGERSPNYRLHGSPPTGDGHCWRLHHWRLLRSTEKHRFLVERDQICLALAVGSRTYPAISHHRCDDSAVTEAIAALRLQTT